jgi:hypothetical protein
MNLKAQDLIEKGRRHRVEHRGRGLRRCGQVQLPTLSRQGAVQWFEVHPGQLAADLIVGDLSSGTKVVFCGRLGLSRRATRSRRSAKDAREMAK